MNHSEMVKEGNRLNAILDMQTNIVQDKSTIPEQAKIVMETGQKHKARLNQLAELIHADCACGHTKAGHQLGGRGKCLEHMDCPCKEWAVELP